VQLDFDRRLRTGEEIKRRMEFVGRLRRDLWRADAEKSKALSVSGGSIGGGSVASAGMNSPFTARAFTQRSMSSLRTRSVGRRSPLAARSRNCDTLTGPPVWPSWS